MQSLRAFLPLVVVLPLSLGNPLRTAQSSDNSVVSTTTTFSSDAIVRPKYNETAKVLFWNDFDFKGGKKRYQVIDDKCYNLPKNLVNYVVSAKLEPKIWYCTFFPQENCEAEDESDEVHQIPAGEYDFLFPEGMDFVSFKCKLYEKRPESVLAHAGSISHYDSLKPHPHALEFTNPLKESTTNSILSPFGVQFFIRRDFQGPSSIQDFFPGSPQCRALTTPEEFIFGSLSLGEEIKKCYFFPGPNCSGLIELQIYHSDPSVRRAGLVFNSIRCELKFDRSMTNSLDYHPNAVKAPSANPNRQPTSISESSSMTMLSPFEIELFILPRLSGPSSTLEFLPGRPACRPLTNHIETAFHSIAIGSAITSCTIFEEPDCEGPIFNEIFSSTEFLPSSRLGLKSIKCSTAFEELEDLPTNLLAETNANYYVASVQLYLFPRFGGPFSLIPYYPGTWGCVPLTKPEELLFQSIQMSPELQSCKFFSDMACRGQVLLEIRESTAVVEGTQDMPIRTMFCSFED